MACHPALAEFRCVSLSPGPGSPHKPFQKILDRPARPLHPPSAISILARMRLSIFCIFFFALISPAQTISSAPACDNANNTSASTSYHSNGSHNASAGQVSKLPIRSLLYPGATTRIFVRYMPWFGDPHHINVGYRSNDAQQVGRQVADMASRGIQGAIVDWYGPSQGLKNQSTLLLMKAAERNGGFQFAVSVDKGALGQCTRGACDPTQRLISVLTYAASTFEQSPAYIKFDGRPAVFFFGLQRSPIDWQRVRSALPLHPLFFFRNSIAFGNPAADGAYSWVAPETVRPDDPMAVRYLERFYSRAQHSSKIAMGSAYKGFDDAEASWGKGRAINQQCGETWLTTLAEPGEFFSASHQLPALIIPTWNDYEEGTEIESGIDNCVQVKGKLKGHKLAWRLKGNSNTVDHVSILARTTGQWSEVMRAPVHAHAVNLSDLHLSPSASDVCVVAVGKASILDHATGPIPIASR